MNQPKIKNVYENNRKFINWKYILVNFYVLAYNNGAKIAKQCKHSTKLKLIYDFYYTLYTFLSLGWSMKTKYLST